MTSIRRSAVVLGSAICLLLTGCGDAGTGGGAGEGQLSVLAGFYPLQWAAERVGGERVSVTSATPPGAEPHDLELTPQDVAAISEADLVVHVEGFQPGLDEAVASEAADAAWDAGQAADLSLTTAGEDDHAHEGEEEHAEEGASVDPHFWLDPTRLADVVDALAERLTELDPDGADTYAGNAAALRADLEALDTEMQEALSGCAVGTLVTGHDAFGYLGDRYGLDVVGINGLSPTQEPSAAQLAAITELVADRGITTVYTETLVDPAVAETVAAEAGVQTAVLDPLEGLTDESAGGDYLEVMRANLVTLQEGQNCS
ncbi:metal ABC transporter substrate-binding protein [Blastococcus sp. DSM 46786]|uniref:metal ABC transporter substrate-binding protein n=1 Tax=Blastococcus sp. DSM 46786 TaxID=1798227 RepID=UPI001FCE0DE8|nr:metal ABC transporter substrate-binding protein [Blastococcus sp. DSM 46786]